jgi:hypothetical protein
LDLATAVAFGTDAANTKTVAAANFVSATATSIKVVVPEGIVTPCGVAVLVGATPYAWTGGTIAIPSDLAITNNGSAGRDDGGVLPGWSVKFDGINLDKITSVKLDGEEYTALTEDDWNVGGYLSSNGWLVRDNNTALYVRVPADAPLGRNIEVSINNGAITQTIYIQPDPEAELTYKTLWNFNTTTAPDNAAYSGENLGVIGIAKEWGGNGVLGTKENDADDHFITWPAWTGEYWMVADNWMFPFPAGIFKAGYNIKVDVKLANDVLIPSADGEWAAIRLLFKIDNVEYVHNILPYLESGDVWTTGGTWKTITIPLATSQWQNADGDDVDLPGTVWKVADRGIVFAANEGSVVDFTGLSIDNVLFDSNGSNAQPDEPEPVDPGEVGEIVTDPADYYVFFDFNNVENPSYDKGIGWGNATVEDDAAYATSGGYAHVSATVEPTVWHDFFWRNNGNKYSQTVGTQGVDPATWSVKMDIRVLSTTPLPSFKFRLGDYWFVTPEYPASNEWVTITLPLSGFVDNDGNGTESITLAQLANLMTDAGGNMGAGAGYGGGEYDFLIDNVRFAQPEP